MKLESTLAGERVDLVWKEFDPVRVTRLTVRQKQKTELIKLALSKQNRVRISPRTPIVLLAVEGLQNNDIAARLKVLRDKLEQRYERFAQSSLEAIVRHLLRQRAAGEGRRSEPDGTDHAGETASRHALERAQDGLSFGLGP